MLSYITADFFLPHSLYTENIGLSLGFFVDLISCLGVLLALTFGIAGIFADNRLPFTALSTL